jgi:glycosyltransferase involved in cell wall biosynthesis
MRFLFIDLMDVMYDMDTPKTKPLRGTQSAVCYVAQTLHAKGHRVFLCTQGIDRMHTLRGVVHFPLGMLNSPLANTLHPDIVVGVNSTEVASQTVRVIGCGHPVCWVHCNPEDAMATNNIFPTDHVSMWFVSEWQRDDFTAKGYKWLESQKITIIHNGICPLFETSGSPPPISQRPHRILYASSSDRGQNVAEWIVQKIGHGGVEFVTCAPTNPSKNDSKGSGLPHAEYMGVLDSCRVLVLPGGFPETFCITIAEALSRGCKIVAGNTGAIPSLFGEFPDVHLLPPLHLDSPSHDVDMWLSVLTEQVLSDENSKPHNSHYSWKRSTDAIIGFARQYIQNKYITDNREY